MQEGTFHTASSAPASARARIGAAAALPWIEGSRLLERLRLVAGWETFIERLGLSFAQALRVAERARSNGTDFHTELITAGLTSEDRHFRALAEELGLPFEETVDPARLGLRDRDPIAALSRPHAQAMLLPDDSDAPPALLIAPTRLDLPAMKAMLARRAGVRARMRITAPTILRAALLERAGPLLAEGARGGLFGAMPEMSARYRGHWRQGFWLGCVAVGLPVGLLLAPAPTWLALQVFFSLVFLACVGLRLAAGSAARPARTAPLRPAGPDELPTYSVIVALRGEEEVVGELVAALGRLVWPRSKLEVKLICEADDDATLDAIRALKLRPWVEVIRVPPGEPRTKPKALAHALPATSGALVALFDAEDRPHPMQLMEAWDRFRRDETGTLACVQAPLVIANGWRGALPALFRLEYAAHFGGMLPWLAGRGLVLPLGGTSNHFRREHLLAVHGWDPFNVTEDADLGLRLARFGYRSETIGCPTLEDAPEEAMVWVRQRSRWFKGWMQTWLVHMREPRRLLSDLGPASFAAAQALFAGMILSAFAYPLLLANLAWVAVESLLSGGPDAGGAAAFAMGAASLLAAYGSFLLLAWRCLEGPERRGFWRTAALVPAYWLLHSYAAARAVVDLARRPHHWEKTPHRRWRRRGGAGAAQRPMMSGPAHTTPVSSRPIAASSRPS